MAFQKKTWVNRIVQYPLRRLLTMVRPDDGSGTEIVDIQREDGEITQEGDAFSAENMNDLESRIEDAFEDIQIDVDDELDNTSTNPVQNKVITQELSTVDTKATNAASAASSASSKANTAQSTASSASSKANTAQSTANAALANQAKSIEPGTTATVAHSKGDYIVYGSNKKFAEVLSNISVGTALTAGTGGNIKNLTQGEVLTNLNEALSKEWTQIMVITTSEDAKSWNYLVELSKYKEIRFIVAGPDSNYKYLVAVTTLNSDYIKIMIDQATTFYLWYGNLVGSSYGLGGNMVISATSIEKGFIFLNNGNANKRAAYVMVLGR